MSLRTKTIYFAALWGGAASLLFAQIPAAQTSATRPAKATITASPAAIAASKLDPAAVDRGGKLFVANCGICHGATAKGTNIAPDLVRSLLVLDDENGNLIRPVLRDGREGTAMPKANLTGPQIDDVIVWLHAQTFAANHRTNYAFLNVVTGDPKKGEFYFNGAGKCSSCHSPTGDLAGIGARLDPLTLQGRWLQPRVAGRGGAAAGTPSKTAITITVTLPSGQSFTGTPDRIDEFHVAFHDSTGAYRSFARESDTNPKVEMHDPLKAHVDMLGKYTDGDIHNVTAYLVTLQ